MAAKFNDRDIEEARVVAERLNLYGKQLIMIPSTKVIIHVCNGIGPEWFPSKVRSFIDKLHPSLKVVAMLHDLAYFFGTETEEDFKAANLGFQTNGVAVADDSFGWYNPRRYLVRFDAGKMSKLCDIGGRTAYYAAIADRQRMSDPTIDAAYYAWAVNRQESTNG